MYLAELAACVITERRDNEIEWDRRRVAPLAGSDSLFISLGDRAIRPTQRRSPFATAFRAACSKQLTVAWASERGMKRGRSWNGGDLAGREGVRILSSPAEHRVVIVPSDADTFAVTAAPRPFERFAPRDAAGAEDCVTAKINFNNDILSRAIDMRDYTRARLAPAQLPTDVSDPPLSSTWIIHEASELGIHGGNFDCLERREEGGLLSFLSFER